MRTVSEQCPLGCIVFPPREEVIWLDVGIVGTVCLSRRFSEGLHSGQIARMISHVIFCHSRASREIGCLMRFHMINIGEAIRDELKRQNRTVVWLASELSCHRSKIYKIFACKSIDSHELLRISRILEHDFFALYSQVLKEN